MNEATQRLTIEVEEQFWAQVEKTETCWFWRGETYPGANGLPRYGRARLPGMRNGTTAHRVAWYLTHGAFPQGHGCHTCDTPLCVRPDHLYDGTPRQNTQDAVRRGRMAAGDRHWTRVNPAHLARGDDHWLRRQPWRLRGERNGKARLTEDLVRGIRANLRLGVGPAAIARQLGLPRTTIVNVQARRAWAWVE